jgi:hypothetical protein
MDLTGQLGNLGLIEHERRGPRPPSRCRPCRGVSCKAAWRLQRSERVGDEDGIIEVTRLWITAAGELVLAAR